MAELDPRSLLAMAEAALDEVEEMFAANVGAAPLVTKARGDFATEADFAIEQRLREVLAQLTGFPVYGEEFGGKRPTSDTVWVIDPIDGTTNYAAGFPMCAMLLSLLHKGEPIVSVTSMPMLGRRVTATKGGGTFMNGREVHLDPEAGRPISIAFGSVIARHDGTFPRSWRQLLLARVGERYPTIRISGSVGVDLASTAMGAFGGTVTFSPHIWDNAAGVLQIREAGGIVTDIAGDPWTRDSVGVLAGTNDVHATLLSIIQDLQPPEDFRA